MRLSERIQNGNTTNFLKSLNEGVKLDEARKNPEVNNKVAPREDGKRYWSGATNKSGNIKRNKVNGIRNFSKERPYGRDNDSITYEKMPNEISWKYKQSTEVQKGPYRQEFKDKVAKETNKEVKEFKDKHKKNESANLKEEISEEVIGVAKQIADKIQEKGIMNFEEVDSMAAELLGITVDELKNKELDTDVHIALNYQGIDNNFDNGDFFTQEYAKEHPEVLGESAITETVDEENSLDDIANYIKGIVDYNITITPTGKGFSSYDVNFLNNDDSIMYSVTVNDDTIKDKVRLLNTLVLELDRLYRGKTFADIIREDLLTELNKIHPLEESAKTLTLRPTSSKLNEAESLELKEEYTINDLDNLVWSGARDRWVDYTDEQKEFLVDWFIESSGYIDGNIPTTTEFNDFIWFEADDILEENGMTGDTSEEDEEETEEV